MSYYKLVKFIKEHSTKWILIDCTNAILGRLSSFIAYRLMGKHNIHFSNHIDCGDNIIAINTDKIISYNKKIHYRHTGYPGGLKSISMKQKLHEKSDITLIDSVRRMLSKPRLIKNMRAYKNSNHTHEAQSPKIIDFVSMNAKNSKR